MCIRDSGHPVRCLKNPFARAFGQMEYDSSITNEEIEKFGAGSLRKAAVEGDVENGSFMAGQIAALVKEEQPAAQIIREMFTQAESLLSEAAKWVK